MKVWVGSPDLIVLVLPFGLISCLGIACWFQLGPLVSLLVSLLVSPLWRSRAYWGICGRASATASFLELVVYLLCLFE